MMIFSLVGTLFVYILSLVFLKSILDVDYLSFENIGKILIVTLVSCMPFYIVVKFKQCIYPEAHEKLNLIKN
jgi:hypothetical protein